MAVATQLPGEPRRQLFPSGEAGRQMMAVVAIILAVIADDDSAVVIAEAYMVTRVPVVFPSVSVIFLFPLVLAVPVAVVLTASLSQRRRDGKRHSQSEARLGASAEELRDTLTLYQPGIEDMGGELLLESDTGKGATFTVRIPL